MGGNSIPQTTRVCRNGRGRAPLGGVHPLAGWPPAAAAPPNSLKKLPAWRRSPPERLKSGALLGAPGAVLGPAAGYASLGAGPCSWTGHCDPAACDPVGVLRTTAQRRQKFHGAAARSLGGRGLGGRGSRGAQPLRGRSRFVPGLRRASLEPVAPQPPSRRSESGRRYWLGAGDRQPLPGDLSGAARKKTGERRGGDRRYVLLALAARLGGFSGVRDGGEKGCSPAEDPRLSAGE